MMKPALLGFVVFQFNLSFFRFEHILRAKIATLCKLSNTWWLSSRKQ